MPTARFNPSHLDPEPLAQAPENPAIGSGTFRGESKLITNPRPFTVPSLSRPLLPHPHPSLTVCSNHTELLHLIKPINSLSPVNPLLPPRMSTPPFGATSRSSSGHRPWGTSCKNYSLTQPRAPAALPGCPLAPRALSKGHFGQLPSAELSPEPGHQPLGGQARVLFISPVIHKVSGLLVGTQ